MLNEPLSGQRGTSHSARRESCCLTAPLRRLGAFFSLNGREGDNVNPGATGLADREAAHEAEQSPGLPSSDLEALFGQGVQALGLETAAVGDGSPPFFMKWDKNNIRKLIDVLGIEVLNAANEYGINLVHFALMGRQLKCATLLFDYAERERCLVGLCWKRGDILDYALAGDFKELVEFVLDRIARKCSRPAESARVISNHFGDLRRKFPEVLEESIRKGRFCFEYGRFEAPLDIFKNAATGAIARIGDIPEAWKELDEEEIKETWKDTGLADRIDDQSGRRVTAVSKFVLIESPFRDGDRNVVSHLVSARYGAELFMCETVKALVGWRWHHCIERGLRISVTNRFISVLLFFIFAGTYGLYAEDLGDRKSTLTLVARISIALCYIHFLPWLFKYTLNPTIGWVPYGASLTYLLIHAFLFDHHTDVSAFLTSIQCVMYLVVLLRRLRPFWSTGPFISMLDYVFKDTLPFVLFTFMTVVSSGMAFLVLFSDRFDKSESEDYKYPLRAFVSQFFALLGVFDPEAFRSPDYSFLRFWRCALFVSYLIVAAIVLLSLLVAVLGDTVDRVVLNRNAELIKCRAIFVGRRIYSAKLLDMLFGFRDGSVERLGWLAPVFGGSRAALQQEYDLMTQDSRILHFLVPVEPIATGSEFKWSGRLRALKRLVVKALLENGSDISRGVDSETSADLINTIRRLENQYANIESQLSTILSLLNDGASGTSGGEPLSSS